MVLCRESRRGAASLRELDDQVIVLDGEESDRRCLLHEMRRHGPEMGAFDAITADHHDPVCLEGAPEAGFIFFRRWHGGTPD